MRCFSSKFLPRHGLHLSLPQGKSWPSSLQYQLFKGGPERQSGPGGVCRGGDISSRGPGQHRCTAVPVFREALVQVKVWSLPDSGESHHIANKGCESVESDAGIIDEQIL